MKLLSVIIVNWNGKDFVFECLDGLRRQSVADFLTVLVDNASTDGSLEYVQANYPEVKTIALAYNSGFAAANNIALKYVKTDYVATLNIDTVPHPEWLGNLLSGLEEHPEAGCAASRMLLYDQPNTIDRAGDAYTRAGIGLLRGRGKDKQSYSRKEWVFGVCAGAALYRKQMLDEIRFFDEDFFLLYEDVDLSFRAQLRGYKCLYVPEAVVYHKGSGSIGDDTPTSVYYSHRNLEWVYIHNMPRNLIIKTIVPHILYDLAAFLFFAAKGRSREFIKAKYHSMKKIKRALEKRRRIQDLKKVSDGYIWSIMEKERYFPRLTRRLIKKAGPKGKPGPERA